MRESPVMASGPKNQYKQPSALRLNQTSNFSLKPKARPHELNSFYDTFTKLDSIKSKLRKAERTSHTSIKKSTRNICNPFSTLQQSHRKSPFKESQHLLILNQS